MNYKKQLFAQYRRQCLSAYGTDVHVQPDPLELGGQIIVTFTWTDDPKTNEAYECMIIVYKNKPLVQRISISNIFTTGTLYRLACEAEKYALCEGNV